MHNIIDFILKNIKDYGYPFVFVGSIIEEIVAPIPSPIVMMSSGAALVNNSEVLSSQVVIDILLVSLVGAIGALVGSLIWYFIGYFGGKPLIEKTSKFTGIKWKKIEQFDEKLKKGKSDEITIALLRAIPIVPSVLVSTACGVLRVPFWTYVFSFFIGGFFRNIIFVVIGWRVGDALNSVAKGFDSAQNIVTVLIALVLVGGLGYLYLHRHRSERAEKD